MTHPFADYNKYQDQGVLVGNWVEEAALKSSTGTHRYQVKPRLAEDGAAAQSQRPQDSTFERRDFSPVSFAGEEDCTASFDSLASLPSHPRTAFLLTTFVFPFLPRSFLQPGVEAEQESVYPKHLQASNMETFGRVFEHSDMLVRPADLLLAFRLDRRRLSPFGARY